MNKYNYTYGNSISKNPSVIDTDDKLLTILKVNLVILVGRSMENIKKSIVKTAQKNNL